LSAFVAVAAGLTRLVSLGFILAEGGASVAASDCPQIAFLMARAANIGAGVSGASKCVVSAARC
jgi:hypothetical protein